MEALNEYAGLFSLLAVLAAILVPVIIHRVEAKEKGEKLKMNWMQWTMHIGF